MFKTELYIHQKEKLPNKGRHIIANYSDKSIIVYQAFNKEISNHAVKHQKFGGQHYSFNRMTWIKPGFMWMMYRSGWAQKPNQEHILAIELKLNGFLEILKNATHSSFQPELFAAKEDWQNSLKKYKVRLQWDPDHNPKGAKLERKAIQLGLKDAILERFNNEWILAITDITDYVKNQFINAKNLVEELKVPVENVLHLENSALKNRLGIVK